MKNMCGICNAQSSFFWEILAQLRRDDGNFHEELETAWLQIRKNLFQILEKFRKVYLDGIP
jgi:NMD protein affecting ribosome stability and mRNA decay